MQTQHPKAQLNWILLRGLIVFLLGAGVILARDMAPSAWLVVTGVPAALTAFNVWRWRRSRMAANDPAF
ncbi:hypothetical protein HF313_05525 [Massilia atriviolacea]|uniref:Uncharacterized protein n=1 Tax=Massilia atriviolacea TaxID=2495579 RepID=A0A430HH99_9BURK|nr:hypothetical protein [Massilia atriviolacea]RSZ56895.1 hypothetical protein EJB06_21405 [Massilia atriviolacea]